MARLTAVRLWLAERLSPEMAREVQWWRDFNVRVVGPQMPRVGDWVLGRKFEVREVR